MTKQRNPYERHGRYGRALLTVLALLCVLGIVVYSYVNGGAAEVEPYNLSVIVYGSSKDRWAFMREGVSQAAMEFPAEISFVYMSQDADAEEQIRALQGEIDNGADGILLAAADSAALADVVEEAGRQVPVLMIETDVNGASSTLGILGADDYEMGRKLGEMVRREHPGQGVALIDEYMERESMQERCRGFLDGLGADADVVYWKRGEGDFRLSLLIKKMYHAEGAGRVITALDDVTLEAAVDAVLDMDEENETEGGDTYEIALYGIGATDKIVYHLDREYISGIVFQNEFGIGYLGVESMVHYLEQRSTVTGELPVIGYYEANRENLYEAEVQRLLFPDVQ